MALNVGDVTTDVFLHRSQSISGLRNSYFQVGILGVGGLTRQCNWWKTLRKYRPLLWSHTKRLDSGSP